MDLSRLRQGEKIAAGAAIVLLVLMFLPWFGLDEESALSQGEDFQEGASTEELLEASGDIESAFADVDEDATSVNFNAWESFEVIDLILVLTILIALGLAVARATGRDVNLPVSGGALTAALGILSVLLILYRLIDPPSVSFLEYDRQFGVFLGLIAAAGIAYGGWRAMQEEGTTFSAEADRLQDRAGDREPPPPPPPPAAPPPTGGTGAGSGAPPGGPTV